MRRNRHFSPTLDSLDLRITPSDLAPFINSLGNPMDVPTPLVTPGVAGSIAVPLEIPTYENAPYDPNAVGATQGLSILTTAIFASSANSSGQGNSNVMSSPSTTYATYN